MLEYIQLLVLSNHLDPTYATKWLYQLLLKGKLVVIVAFTKLNIVIVCCKVHSNLFKLSRNHFWQLIQMGKMTGIYQFLSGMKNVFFKYTNKVYLENNPPTNLARLYPKRSGLINIS